MKGLLTIALDLVAKFRVLSVSEYNAGSGARLAMTQVCAEPPRES